MTSAPPRPVPAAPAGGWRRAAEAGGERPSGEPGRWRWRTVALADPGPLLDHLPGAATAPGAPLAWVRRGEGLVGWGEVARLRLGGARRAQDADRAWRELVTGAEVEDAVQLPGTGPVAFASLSFAEWSAAGSALVVPAVVLGHRAGAWWLTTATPLPDGSGGGAGDRTDDRSDDRTGGSPDATDEDAGGAAPQLPHVESPERPGAISYADGARSGLDWAGVVAAAVTRIQAGELDKVVLARDLEARAQRPVDVRWLLHRLAGAYPTCWTFAVDGLVGATPELLVRRERGLVHSRVLAGTIRRTGDADRDAGLAGSLARSGKDLEEHAYAVRSVLDALAPHCRTTTAPDAPFVLHLPNVMHLASDVTGVLDDTPDDARQDGPPSVLALAAALHPTAAVCGTPTAAASALIDAVEAMDRDRYAGPVGWVDASGDGEVGIALRCARVDADDPRRVRLFAGCGVVAGSDPMAELAESDAKLVPVRDALDGG